MVDDYRFEIAKALIRPAAEVVVHSGQRAFASLLALVKRRFATESPAQLELLDDTKPPSDERAEDLAGALKYLARSHPEFAAALREGWDEVQPHIKHSGNTTTSNVNYGDVSGGATVIQAGNIGNINDQRK